MHRIKFPPALRVLASRRCCMGAIFAMALMAVSACTVAPVKTSDVSGPFSVQAAERVFAAGFDHISRKYIDEVEIPSMVLEGLRGLTSLDTTVSIKERHGFLTLSIDNRNVIRMPTPESDDVEGWAHLAALVTLEAGRQSDDIGSTDLETIYETVFDGALSTLDVYSRYAGASEARINRSQRDGYGGIGVRFTVRNGLIIVTKVVEGSPSARSGIMQDDRILAINGVPTEDQKSADIRKALRGPVDSTVSLTVMRDSGQTVEHQLERKRIIPPTVTATRKDDILYLKVKSFNQNTARSFSNSIRQSLEGQDNADPLQGIIVDLRGNPGGLLKQSIEVADTLLIDGDILNTTGRHPDSIQHYEAAGGDVANGLPLVILIDGQSASASEIVAAALQDQARAVILGTSSYGKGTVQTVVRLPNDGEITLTWSRFMAPSGYALHGLGVYPVICTSGSSADKPGALNDALNADTNTSQVIRVWRETPLLAIEERRDLRNNCPPEQHSSDSDVELARALLLTPGLYKEALALSGNRQTAAD